MFGMDEIFAFPGADVVFVAFVLVMDVVLITLARKFFKKV